MDVFLEAADTVLGSGEEEQMAAESKDQQVQVAADSRRYDSAFDITSGRAKWFVDACGYFWAVAEALEHLAKASEDVVSSFYGTAKDVTLFWAHHEKLLLVDERLAFMGGLDLCFGRWDTNMERMKSSRMGWSDVAFSLDGPIVQDLLHHFVDRWNFVFDDKYGTQEDNKYQKLPVPESPQRQEGIAEGEEDDCNLQMQIVRRHETEHSILNAYVDAITNAEHFVYIENQFFITACEDQLRPVTNLIGAAIVDRISHAFHDGGVFKVIVVMPAVPAFAGDLKSDEALGTRAILEFQYNSICRGGHSILEKLREVGIDDPTQYIGFYNLRSFDRINKSKTMQDAEADAGLGYETAHEEQDAYVESAIDCSDPGFAAENNPALSPYYQSQREDAQGIVLDTVSSCYMEGGSSLADMCWDGDAEEEIDAYISEQLYIHSKFLIADDRIAICGSANLNDRSQLGNHDSEIAVVIEDPTPMESTMNGEPYTASAFAASLRRFIFRKHLGLLPHQTCNQPDANWLPVTSGQNEYDWGSPSDILVSDPLAASFEDLWKATARVNTGVFSRAFHPVPNDRVRTWEDYADFFARHFRIPNGEKPEKGSSNDEGDDDPNGGSEAEAEGARYDYGHIVREEFQGGIVEVKEWLSRIRGNLVEMPLDFLADVEDIAKDGLTLNGLTDKLYT
ncbi:phospholipase D/nuclease [Sarocladium strictum]